MNIKQPVIREIGTSQGIIVPKPVLEKMAAGVGSPVKFRVDSGRLEVTLVIGKAWEGKDESL